MNCLELLDSYFNELSEHDKKILSELIMSMIVIQRSKETEQRHNIELYSTIKNTLPQL